MSYWDKFAVELDFIVMQTNSELEEDMSITGAAFLAESIKARIQSAKDKVAASHTKIDGALTKIVDAAGHADNVASMIEAEADTLVAQIGQFSNMAPEEEPKA